MESASHNSKSPLSRGVPSTWAPSGPVRLLWSVLRARDVVLREDLAKLEGMRRRQPQFSPGQRAELAGARAWAQSRSLPPGADTHVSTASGPGPGREGAGHGVWVAGSSRRLLCGVPVPASGQLVGVARGPAVGWERGVSDAGAVLPPVGRLRGERGRALL